jgi:hypothetical protein
MSFTLVSFHDDMHPPGRFWTELASRMRLRDAYCTFPGWRFTDTSCAPIRTLDSERAAPTSQHATIHDICRSPQGGAFIVCNCCTRCEQRENRLVTRSKAGVVWVKTELGNYVCGMGGDTQPQHDQSFLNEEDWGVFPGASIL